MQRGSAITPQQLLVTGLVLVTTNVIATSVLLWFPQMNLTDPGAWIPASMDYLFIGFTMSTAFSPTDSLPLTRRAKAVFMLGATVAITTFVIIAARAANIL